MTRQEIDRLLALYSSGSLSVEEHRRLTEAALQDQALFEELMAEDELRTALADPGVAAEVAAWPEPRPARQRQGWFWRWGVPAGALALTAAMGVVLLRPAWKAPAPTAQVAQVTRQGSTAESLSAPNPAGGAAQTTGPAAASNPAAGQASVEATPPERRQSGKLPEAQRHAPAAFQSDAVGSAPRALDASSAHSSAAGRPEAPPRAERAPDVVASNVGASPGAPPPPPPPPPAAASAVGAASTAQSRPVERPRAVFGTPPPIPLPGPVDGNGAGERTVRASESAVVPEAALAARKENSDQAPLQFEAARMNSKAAPVPQPGALAGVSNTHAQSFAFGRADALGVFQSLHLERKTESGTWTLVAPSAAVDQGTPLRLMVTPRQTGILRIEAGVWKDNQGHSVSLAPQATYRLEATRARGIELNPLEPGTYLVNLKFTPIRLSPGVPAPRDPNAPVQPDLRFTVR